MMIWIQRFYQLGNPQFAFQSVTFELRFSQFVTNPLHPQSNSNQGIRLNCIVWADSWILCNDIEWASYVKTNCIEGATTSSESVMYREKVTTTMVLREIVSATMVSRGIGTMTSRVLGFWQNEREASPILNKK